MMPRYSIDMGQFQDSYNVTVVTSNPLNKAGKPFYDKPRRFAVRTSPFVCLGFSYGTKVEVMDLATGLSSSSREYVPILQATYSKRVGYKRFPRVRLAQWLIQQLHLNQIETNQHSGYYPSARELYRISCVLVANQCAEKLGSFYIAP